jgi:hypothetical protein
MPYKDQEYMDAIRRSGASPALLETMLTKFVVLMGVEEARAQIRQLSDERAKIVDENSSAFAAAMAPYDEKIAMLQAQLVEMEKQAALVIAPPAL